MNRATYCATHAMCQDIDYYTDPADLTVAENACPSTEHIGEHELRCRLGKGAYDLNPELRERHGMTRNEVAAALGLTRQQVSDIERAALKKLARHPIIRELWGAR